MAHDRERAQDGARRLLRLFLNDTPELNRLIRREEATDAKLDLALALAIDDYNLTPPPLHPVTIETFPSIWLLLYGASIQVLRSSGLLQARNELVYQAGGVSVRIFDKGPAYQSWIASFVQEYEVKKRNFKIAHNINSSLAVGVPSEYATLLSMWG